LEKELKSEDLLVPIFKEGKRVYDTPSLDQIQAKTLAGLEKFHSGVKRFVNPHPYVVGMEKSLYDLKIELIKKVRTKRAV
jgi:nicotinate phosphoribosyltransferase